MVDGSFDGVPVPALEAVLKLLCRNARTVKKPPYVRIFNSGQVRIFKYCGSSTLFEGKSGSKCIRSRFSDWSSTAKLIVGFYQARD